jgi:hypothetical protein
MKTPAMPRQADTYPFRARVRAWWRGYDLAELYRRLSRFNSGQVTDVDERQRPAAVDNTARQVARRLESPAASIAAPALTPQYLAATQIIWGNGSIGPCVEARLRDALDGATLGADSRILHLGAGLGGLSERLRQACGGTVVAAETLAALTAVSSGSLHLVDAKSPALVEAADAIIIDGIAERSEPLAAILRSQAAAMKPGATLVVRSLVNLRDSSSANAAVIAWANAEPIPVRLRSTDDISRILQDSGFSIQTTASIADDYTAEVEQKWGEAIERIRLLHRSPQGRDIVPIILADCERWLRRVELIREGAIGVRQIVAHRRGRARRAA